MRRRLFEVISAYELNPPMYFMLRHVQESESMKDVAERMCLDASTVTGIADRLEAKGLVERRQSPDDRRVKELVLTEAGVALCREIEAQFDQEPLLPELSDADRLRLVSILGRVVPS